MKHLRCGRDAGERRGNAGWLPFLAGASSLQRRCSCAFLSLPCSWLCSHRFQAAGWHFTALLPFCLLPSLIPYRLLPACGFKLLFAAATHLPGMGGAAREEHASYYITLSLHLAAHHIKPDAARCVLPPAAAARQGTIYAMLGGAGRRLRRHAVCSHRGASAGDDAARRAAEEDRPAGGLPSPGRTGGGAGRLACLVAAGLAQLLRQHCCTAAPHRVPSCASLHFVRYCSALTRLSLQPPNLSAYRVCSILAPYRLFGALPLAFGLLLLQIYLRLYSACIHLLCTRWRLGVLPSTPVYPDAYPALYLLLHACLTAGLLTLYGGAYYLKTVAQRLDAGAPAACATNAGGVDTVLWRGTFAGGGTRPVSKEGFACTLPHLATTHLPCLLHLFVPYLPFFPIRFGWNNGAYARDDACGGV